MGERAVAEVKRILENHEPEPIDEALAKELDHIVKSARKELT